MRKKAFYSILLLFVLLMSGKALANPVGVTVAGSCTNVGGPIASQAYLLAMDASLTEMFIHFTKSVVEAIQAQTMALQAAQGKVSQGSQITAGKRKEDEMNADANIDAFSRFTFGLPIGYCFDPAYYLQRGKEDLSAAVAAMAAAERNMGMGTTASVKERHAQLYKAALNAEEHAFPFASDTYTEEQASAMSDAAQLLFHSTKMPRPEKYEKEKGSVKDSKYRTLEMAAAIFRVWATQPFRQSVADHYPYAYAEEIEAWVGKGVNSPFTMTYQVNPKTGKVEDVAGTIKPVGPNDKMSILSIYDMVGKRFTSKDFLSKLDGLKADGVLKEMIRLMGFEYNVLLDVRNFMQLNNVLLSLSLIKRYEEMNTATADAND